MFNGFWPGECVSVGIEEGRSERGETQRIQDQRQVLRRLTFDRELFLDLSYHGAVGVSE
jgi:hypothetical protein